MTVSSFTPTPIEKVSPLAQQALVMIDDCIEQAGGDLVGVLSDRLPSPLIIREALPALEHESNMALTDAQRQERKIKVLLGCARDIGKKLDEQSRSGRYSFDLADATEVQLHFLDSTLTKIIDKFAAQNMRQVISMLAVSGIDRSAPRQDLAIYLVEQYIKQPLESLSAQIDPDSLVGSARHLKASIKSLVETQTQLENSGVKLSVEPKPMSPSSRPRMS